MEANENGGEKAGLVVRTGRFGDDKDPNLGRDTQFKKGDIPNPNGRPKGRKSLSTAIQDMMNDPKFIEKLSDNIKAKAGIADEDFQDTPMKAIITTALIEAMHPQTDHTARSKARDWLRKAGYGDMVDITSKGERIEQPPVVISSFAPRDTGDQNEEELDSHTSSA